MGCCCYPENNPDGTRNCGQASSAAQCDALMGVYTDADCSSWCFFVTELNSHVVAKSGADFVTESSTRPGLMIAFDFRDVLLRRSVLGREILELYGLHAKSAVEALRKRPILLARALGLVTKGIVLAQDILRAYSLRSYGVATGALKLDQDTVREMLDVSHELGRLSDAKEFDFLVARIEQIFKSMQDMNGRQILEFLAIEAPGASVSITSS